MFKKIFGLLRKEVSLTLEAWMLVVFISPFFIVPLVTLDNSALYLKVCMSMFFGIGCVWWYWFMHEWTKIKRMAVGLPSFNEDN